MSKEAEDKQYFFTCEGLDPLACEPVLETMALAHKLGGAACKVELARRIGEEELILNSDDCNQIFQYLHKNTMPLLRYSGQTGEEQAILGLIYWFDFAKRYQAPVRVEELIIK